MQQDCGAPTVNLWLHLEVNGQNWKRMEEQPRLSMKLSRFSMSVVLGEEVRAKRGRLWSSS